MNYQIILLLLGIFLLRFPPIYYLGIRNFFFTTHVISVVIFIFLFISMVLEYLRTAKKDIEFTAENLLVILFLISQSFSIIEAQNITLFLQRYSKIFLGIIIYFIIKKILKQNHSIIYKKIFTYLFYGSLIAIVFQLILLFLPNLFLDTGSFFIHRNLFDITKANYGSGKLFDDTYLEIVIPILTFYLLGNRRINRFKKIIMFLLIFSIGFIAFASNFRYRLLTFLISLITSIVFFGNIKNIIRNLLITIAAVFIFISLFDKLVINMNTYSLIDRAIDQEEYEDTGTIAWRLKMFDKSVELSKYSLFGVGLGNMADYLNKSSIPLDQSLKLKAEGALESGPHNIFFQFLAETGKIGLAIFVLLLLIFFKKDISLLNSKKIEKKALILCFWSLIFIGQFFPAINLTFYFLFFMLRAMI